MSAGRHLAASWLLPIAGWLPSACGQVEPPPRAGEDAGRAPALDARAADDAGRIPPRLDAGPPPADAGELAGCYDYGSFVPAPVSFRDDVLPLVQAECARCHDDPTASTYYGADGAVVYDKLLNGEPRQAPHLRFVAPGDPLHSYMIAKIEYSNPGGTCSAVRCSEPGCDLPAPPDRALSETQRAVLRSWVLLGARDD